MSWKAEARKVMQLLQAQEASEPEAQLHLKFLTSVSERVNSLQTVRSKMVVSMGGSLSTADHFCGGTVCVRVLPGKSLIRRQ